MIKYAAIDAYKEYSSNITEDKKIEAYLELASIKINDATLTRIEKIGFDNLTDNQKEYIKKALFEQMDYMYEKGMINDDDIESYSIGGDLTINKKESTTMAYKLKLSDNAYMYLKQTGLLCRNI